MVLSPLMPVAKAIDIGNNGKKGNDGHAYGVMMHKNTANNTNFKVSLIVQSRFSSKIVQCPYPDGLDQAVDFMAR